MKVATPTRLGFFASAIMAATLWSAPGLGGEGTIPLRVTGRIVGDAPQQHLLNAEGRLNGLIEIPRESLNCMTGGDAKRYLAQGNIEVFGAVHRILALCIREDDSRIEVFTTDPERGNIYRIIGRFRSE